ncbi:Metacaspase-1 [Seminavis robusta]|uniref:Metacaspase-1 n=1 Tax=Seminavis robusta TaxID=568900 RepID=A0A9N8HQ97_9STRA|nr:Metacaspase-1 [Seminavis robusta]|eukprot:Sro1145_g246240.1 Metacaspase-1 (348) ;mRNA; r:25110-26521
MFGKTGKQYAGFISNQVENLLGDHLSKKGNKTSIETPTEKLGQVTGKRKALFIGINYYGQKGELRGCINDVKNIRAFLEANYPIDEMMVLTDDQTNDPSKMPTRANILKGFRWLRQGASPGDALVLHYSGHGGSQKDTDGDEEDGMDETLCPVDYSKNGVIVDDEVHAVLVKGLPEGVRLTAIMDCCHSESMLDLPYCYNVNGDLEIVEMNKAKGISKLVATGVRYVLDGNKKAAMTSLTQGFKSLMEGDKTGNAAARQKTIDTRSTVADVISFSGCKDSQTSADASIDGQATGAMTYALIRSLKERKQVEYTDLLISMRQILDGKYTQVPMMSAGRKLDMTTMFSF